MAAHNPADHGLDHNVIKLTFGDLKPVVYWCMADEIGLETKTPHTHIFIAADSSIRFSTLKKRFPDAHMEQARGTAEQNRAYVSKSGKWAEDEKADTSVPGTFGEWDELPDEPGQGFRSDIAELYQMIVDGMSNAEIMATNPLMRKRGSEYRSYARINAAPPRQESKVFSLASCIAPTVAKSKTTLYVPTTRATLGLAPLTSSVK